MRPTLVRSQKKLIVPRFWRVPPALLRNPGTPESLDGERILHEYPDDVGLVLWFCYRDVLLWSNTPPHLRPELFYRRNGRDELIEGARLNFKILRAVRVLHDGVRKARPDTGSIVTAALDIAAAAERVGASSTAMAFTQAASAVVPRDAGTALEVGTLALRLRLTPVAETWLRRAIGLARRSRDWVTYGEALIALGRLAEGIGQLQDARMVYEKAIRLARRAGLYEINEAAAAGLLRIALREEDPASKRCARRALRFWKPGQPGRTSVLLDAAEVALRLGDHGRALEMLREALPSQSDVRERIRMLTMLVRATGAAGERAAVEESWHSATGLIEEVGGGEGARLLLVLARAGAEVLEEVHADAAAKRALSWAIRHGDYALRQECEAFLARPRFPGML